MEWKIPVLFPIKGVIFDMDGLMLDTERIIQYSWEVTGAELGYSGFGENILNTLGMSRVQRNQYFLEKYGEDFPLQRFTDRYHEIYHAYEQTHGIPKKKGLVLLLELLKSRQIPMAVATSTHSEYTIPELKRQGIERYFQERWWQGESLLLKFISLPVKSWGSDQRMRWLWRTPITESVLPARQEQRWL